MGNVLVNKIGKKYKRYKYRWARLAELVTRERYILHEERWALRGVSFSVKPGETLGIVGQNGAGKSTLLKILTGTTKPTEGKIQIEGRVAALLELGMGFHTEFTGRENAVMTCKVAGLNREQIRSSLPKIEDFSELVENKHPYRQSFVNNKDIRTQGSCCAESKTHLHAAGIHP